MRTSISAKILLAAVLVAPTAPPAGAALAAQIPVYQGPAPTAVVAYGEHPLQFGNLRLPEGEGP